MSYKITKEEILSATNGGLDIILAYYPQAADTVGKANKKFKLRANEKTASAIVKKLDDGTWIVIDFGGESKPQNAIEVVRFEENISNYGEALMFIASKFNIIAEERQQEVIKPKITQRPAEDKENDGDWKFEYKPYDEVTDFELSTIYAAKMLSDYSRERQIETMRTYRLFALKSYTIISNRKATTISSTENYPIFCFDEKTWQKVYQPRSIDKSLRFMSYGKKPENYIFGLAQLKKQWEKEKPSEEEYDTEDEAKQKESLKAFKLDSVTICSGGSDALNVALMGYNVIWLNSETAKLAWDDYFEISKITKKQYNLPDIDSTGKRAAHELALTYLDIYTIRLPDSLKETKDARGNPCKDVRDYLRTHGSKSYAKLLDVAYPYRFWDEAPRYDRQGNFKGNEYEINNTHMYNFLACCGYYQYTLQNGQADIYININGNIVKEVSPKEIKKFINGFLESRGFNTKLRNTFFRTNQLAPNSFENLPHIQIDFSDSDSQTQYLFFRNKTWVITKDGIQEFRPGELDRYVWQHNIIDHNVSTLPPFFEPKEIDGEYQIDVLDTKCLFFRYLINTTKMYWKVEEIGVEEEMPGGKTILRKQLTEHEKREEKQHLLNRLYTMGYMLHRYKDDSRSWAVYCLESKIMDEADNNGGSGKSIFIKFPQLLMQTVMVPGRDQRVTENKHMLERVDERTRWVYVDDCNKYLDYGQFYPMITDKWVINPKNSKSFEIGYAQAPKLGFSSGYPPHNADQSLERRLIYTAFSDYYHHGPNDEFAEERSPRSEFGKNLFSEFTAEEWNYFLNLCGQSLHFYLKCEEKINPPMDEVSKRQLKSIMGDAFKNWADVYFSTEGERLNTETPRTEAQDDFFKTQNIKGWSSQKFSSALKAWCKYYHYTLNPKDKCNASGRIIKTENKISTEMLYIETSISPVAKDDLPADSNYPESWDKN